MKVTLQFDSLEAAAAALGKTVVASSGNQVEPSKDADVETATKPVVSTTSSNPEPQKRKRRTKAEIEAAKAAEATPAPTPEPEVVTEDDDLFDDFDEPEVVKPVTEENVRAALIAFKNALAAKLVEKGTDAKEASTTAMGKAKSLLNEVAGTEVLGAVPADKYAAVVDFANKQIAKLATK